MSRLSEIIGKNSNTVYNYINGKHDPDITTLKKVCQYFNLTYVEMIDIDLQQSRYTHAGEVSTNEQDNLINEMRAIKSSMKQEIIRFIEDL